MIPLTVSGKCIEGTFFRIERKQFVDPGDFDDLCGISVPDAPFLLPQSALDGFLL